MTTFHHVADLDIRSVLESRNPAHRHPGDVARALFRTLHHINVDSMSDHVSARAVELRAKGYIAAEDAYKRRDMKAAITALRAVWSDRPVQSATASLENA